MNATHIFVQVDTDSLLAYGEKLTKEQISAHCLIYNQGSMALGNAIENFGTLVKEKEHVYFTILPLKLFSNHKLYLTKFEVISDPEDRIVISPNSIEERCITFRASIDAAKANGEMAFGLYAVIIYTDKEGNEKELPIYIDPVLRAKQDKVYQMN